MSSGSNVLFGHVSSPNVTVQTDAVHGGHSLRKINHYRNSRRHVLPHNELHVIAVSKDTRPSTHGLRVLIAVSSLACCGSNHSEGPGALYHVNITLRLLREGRTTGLSVRGVSTGALT